MSDAGGIYIVAGEASGDLHAANLVRALQALRPGIETRGMGGPRLAETGCAVSVDLTEFAVMGLVRVVPLLGRFLEVINRFRDELAARRPAAVVLIDYPGLNFILAGVARRLAIPVVYYCCPQLWAWAPWRVRKLQRLARLLLVIFPFEEEFFRGGAAAVKYVGHPICDALAAIDRGAAAREHTEYSRSPRTAATAGAKPARIAVTNCHVDMREFALYAPVLAPKERLRQNKC